MVKEDVSFLAAGLILITGISDLLINFLALEPRKFKSKFSSPLVIIIIKSALISSEYLTIDPEKLAEDDISTSSVLHLTPFEVMNF